MFKDHKEFFLIQKNFIFRYLIYNIIVIQGGKCLSAYTTSVLIK